jgi:hypothetical protein
MLPRSSSQHSATATGWKRESAAEIATSFPRPASALNTTRHTTTLRRNSIIFVLLSLLFQRCSPCHSLRALARVDADDDGLQLGQTLQSPAGLPKAEIRTRCDRQTSQETAQRPICSGEHLGSCMLSKMLINGRPGKPLFCLRKIATLSQLWLICCSWATSNRQSPISLFFRTCTDSLLKHYVGTTTRCHSLWVL